jgi:hypothetical protein
MRQQIAQLEGEREGSALVVLRRAGVERDGTGRWPLDRKSVCRKGLPKGQRIGPEQRRSTDLGGRSDLSASRDLISSFGPAPASLLRFQFRFDCG